MDQTSRDFDFYYNLLGPLFAGKGVDPLEYACALLRVDGLEDKGWDTLAESFDTLRDLTHLADVNLPAETFPDAEKTRLRLHLISYAHLVECDAPYDILANLCRVKAGLPSSIRPFWDEAEYQRRQKQAAKNPGKLPREAKPPSPSSKIRAFKALAHRAGVPDVGAAFDDFYFPVIRNAIDHSDYIIHGDEFRMRKGQLLTVDATPVESSIVPLPRLRAIIDRSYAFYNAFFTLHEQMRRWFSTMKGKAIPYDLRLKGLLEFLVDDAGLLCGWKVHWPNGTESSYRRDSDGSHPLNIHPHIDEPIGMFVGEYHKDHEPFSRLVPRGEQPAYTPAAGATEPLRWPEDAAIPVPKVEAG
ncbi:MAG: hypothetical protein L0Y44_01320 [Phycisphaerales bacterium]|nr:hypothetical protein [Phycisphaerales bacterium]MCI0674939.1 hypothetical protein [Phycisphaerales bacterium]